MSKVQNPDLKKLMDKKVSIQLNGSRKVVGVLRGYDPFMNLVLDEAVEVVSATERSSLGMIVIRGNSVVLMETIDFVPMAPV